MLGKILHLLIRNDILAEKITRKGSSLSIHIVPGKKAHDLLALNTSVHKYEKV